MSGPEQDFYDRADAIIQLANEQCETVKNSKVSSSAMYGVARFNAFIAAQDFETADGLKKSKEEVLDYFSKQYRAMLNDHLNDYIENFDEYLSQQL